jgi:hypothetical protein
VGQLEIRKDRLLFRLLQQIMNLVHNYTRFILFKGRARKKVKIARDSTYAKLGLP